MNHEVKYSGIVLEWPSPCHLKTHLKENASPGYALNENNSKDTVFLCLVLGFLTAHCTRMSPDSYVCALCTTNK